MARTRGVDRAAIGFSAACLVHCLALPVIAVSFPFFGIWSEAEWVHWLFVVLAIAASSAVMAISPSALRASFLAPAILGIVALGGSLIAEPLGFDETPLTVLGGLLLSAAHGIRLFSKDPCG